MTSALRPPQYRRHNKGYVRHGGKMVYFPGAWDSSESRAAYDQFVECWRRKNDPGTYGRTIADLVVAYSDWCEGYYRKAGQPTPYVRNTKGQLRLLLAQHRHTLICDFDSVVLEAFRDSLDGTLDRRCKYKRRRITRQYINKTLAAVLRMFRWGVRKKMVRVNQCEELRTVPSLQRGYCKAPEAPKVQAADDADVDATLPFLRPPVRSMVELMRLCGCRPGEICVLRPCDVTLRMDGTAVYQPHRHKLEHLNIDRLIYFGPKALEILRPWLDRPGDSYCFQPREAVASLRREQRAKRRSKVQPSQIDRRKEQPASQPGDCYNKDSFNQAVRRACLKAGVPVWRPNQLRHRVAGILQKRYDKEAATAVLGHSNPLTTTRYAKIDYKRAAKAMLEIG